MSEHTGKRIIVIGGGVSGLAAAHRVVELAREAKSDVRVLLLEASHRLGGTILTTRRDGFLIEGGPDSFITQKPWGVQLVARLGLSDQLIGTSPGNRRTFIVRDGRLYPVPEGFLLLAPTKIWPFLTSGLFSWRCKLRMGMDLILPRRDHGTEGDESLASFVRRRFGQEALDRIAQPLVSGIYTADPEELSLRATMPRFLDMETQHRSLIKAMRPKKGNQHVTKGDAGPRYSLFVSFKEGMHTLIDTLASRLPPEAVRLNVSVRKVERDGSGWRVVLNDGGSETADGVVLACPAYTSAGFVRELDGELAGELDRLKYASAATMSMAFKREQVKHRLDGFGFVVPAVENRTLLAVTFSSMKFEGRAPDGWVSMRAFLGGAMHQHVFEMSDAELTAAVLKDMRELIGVEGEPAFVETHRWVRSMPQYPVGHLEHVKKIRAALARHPGLTIAGNAFGGVGVPDCVQSAEAAAKELMNHLTAPPTAPK